jgi:lactoylglutathione lyase
MHLAHAAIWVSDLDRAVAFYAAIGMERRGSFELDGVENVYVGPPGEDGEGADEGDVLQLRHDPDRTTPIAPGRADVDHVAIAVVDVDETFDAAVEAGASELASPHAVPAADSYVAFVADPDGYTLEFVEPLE